MIKNKEEFKNYNIICINDKEIKECFDLLEKLGFKIDKRLLATFSVFINFNKTQNIFLNTKKLESNFDKNITFYEFKKLAKKFLKEEKEKKLEDFEVASDGRITKINNWESGKKVFLIFDNDNVINGFKQSFLETYIKLGLIYATEETRDKAKFKLEIETKLKNIAERLNNGEKIDWEIVEKNKYYILYDFTNNCLRSGSCYAWKEISTIDCLSNKFLNKAIKEIGEENLIKYFKD